MNALEKARKARAVVLALLGVFVTVLVAAAMIAPSLTGSQAAAALVATTKADFTVYPSDIGPKQARCNSDAFLENSLPNSNLRWSNSVSTPFSSPDPSAEFTQLLAENCQNPTVLMMNVEGLSATPVEGTTIGKLNSWMADFIGLKASGMGDGKSAIGFLTKKADNGDKLFVTPSYQKVAMLTNTILLRLHNMGNQGLWSTANYHVTAHEGLKTGKLPVAALNYSKQDNLPALVLEYTSKTGCGTLRIGFNVGDKRFERFAPPTCTHPITTPSSHPSTPSSHPSTHPKPKPTTHPKPSPKPTTTPKPKPTPTPKPTPKPTPTPTPSHSCPPGQSKNVNGVCVTPKDSSKNVTPPAGTTKLGPDPLQTSTPSAGKGVSGNIDTSGKTGSNGKTGSQDNGSSAVPAQGATANPSPAPSAAPQPTATQAAPPSAPATPIGDPG